MGESAKLRYHADALKILAVEPRVDAEAVGRIVAAEADANRQLPAAVKEWYALSGAEELLTLDDNACGVVPLADLLADFVQGASGLEFYGPRRVNTGYQAFVILNGEDDPPVRIDGEAGPVPFSRYVRDLAGYKETSG